MASSHKILAPYLALTHGSSQKEIEMMAEHLPASEKWRMNSLVGFACVRGFCFLHLEMTLLVVLGWAVLEIRRPQLNEALHYGGLLWIIYQGNSYSYLSHCF